MNVTLQVPGALAGYAGGRRVVRVELPGSGAGATVCDVLDRLGDELPALERRIRDERADLRRQVNVYLDGTDIRSLAGLDTAVPDHGVLDVIAAISGG
jgi:molybdopterin converting factor small subunit